MKYSNTMFPLQREHTANYVPVTAYVECSANRKSLTPEQFAIIENLLTFFIGFAAIVAKTL